jgi:hypothetical protein
MPMARPNRRSGSQTLIVFSDETTLGWRVLRRISVAEYQRRKSRGEMRPVFDESGNLIGCQPIKVFDQHLTTRSTPAAIIPREVVLLAGTAFRDGRSRTAGLTEQKRMERASRVHPRTGKLLPPEDAIERVEEKVRLQTESANYHDGGRDRAPRVYPRAR